PTNAPHGPYRVDEKYSKPYLKEGVPEARARYFGMCTNIDENIGLLGGHLRQLGLDKDTIFIFLTDNGGTGGFDLDRKYHGFVTSGYNAGMRGGKQSMYEGGHRVPCFIRAHRALRSVSHAHRTVQSQRRREHSFRRHEPRTTSAGKAYAVARAEAGCRGQ
ncbi:MAG: sulfatase-like hydrolase/transferase, partial [Planctomycetota bacterium]